MLWVSKTKPESFARVRMETCNKHYISSFNNEDRMAKSINAKIVKSISNKRHLFFASSKYLIMSVYYFW